VGSFSSEQIGQVDAGIAGGRSAGLLVEIVVRGSVLVVAVDGVGASGGFGAVALMSHVSLSLAVESSLMLTGGGCDFLLFCSGCLLSGFEAGLLEMLLSFCLFLSCITDVMSNISSSLSVDTSSGIDWVLFDGLANLCCASRSWSSSLSVEASSDGIVSLAFPFKENCLEGVICSFGIPWSISRSSSNSRCASLSSESSFSQTLTILPSSGFIVLSMVAYS
jgi:hypothetical protein